MEPIKTPESNVVLTGEGEVQPLPAKVENGVASSTWKLDELERLQVAEGGCIQLAVLSTPPPPVSLLVVAPICKECGRYTTWSAEFQGWTCAKDEVEDA